MTSRPRLARCHQSGNKAERKPSAASLAHRRERHGTMASSREERAFLTVRDIPANTRGDKPAHTEAHEIGLTVRRVPACLLGCSTATHNSKAMQSLSLSLSVRSSLSLSSCCQEVHPICHQSRKKKIKKQGRRKHTLKILQFLAQRAEMPQQHPLSSTTRATSSCGSAADGYT